MPRKSTEERGALESNSVEGLMEKCRCGGNPRDCQLYDLRKRTLEERGLWVGILTCKEKEAILARHETCFRHRQEKTIEFQAVS